jgi:hypothetical protein
MLAPGKNTSDGCKIISVRSWSGSRVMWQCNHTAWLFWELHSFSFLQGNTIAKAWFWGYSGAVNLLTSLSWWTHYAVMYKLHNAYSWFQAKY